MDSKLPEIEKMQGRLTRLEGDNRRLKQLGATAIVIVTSVLFMAQAPRKRTIEADEFVLKDSGGNVRARLSMNSELGSPEMLLLDESGKTRLKLAAGLKGFIGGGISVFDGQGRERGMFSADNDRASLALLDGKGLPIAMLNSDGITGTEFTLKDVGGSIRARLFMTAKNTANITNPGTTNSIPMTFGPTPTLALYDNKGSARSFVDGEGTVHAQAVAVSDPQGHTLGSFLAVADYGAMLALDNGRGEQRLFMEPGHVELSDDDGYKAGLGVEKNLVTPRTGETHKTSAASLLLFDRDKNVIWKAP